MDLYHGGHAEIISIVYQAHAVMFFLRQEEQNVSTKKIDLSASYTVLYEIE